jgi:arsenite methyltransferase
LINAVHLAAKKEIKMSEHDDVRKKVSEAYTEAVITGKGITKHTSPVEKAKMATFVGYDPAELSILPNDAVASSFGCGNPLAFSGVSEGDVVLDLGSGAGIDLILAAKKVGADGKVIGIDMTDEMIERARKNIEEAGHSNVEVRKGVIEELPVDDSSVDWVISNCVINLSPDKSKVFGEIARVLKPGGQMSVSDIVAENLPPEIRENQDLYCSCIGGAISEDEYLAGLRKAGLSDVEVKERLEYDAVALSCGSDEDEGLGGCCGNDDNVTKFSDQLKGKIWSAKVYAKKPA